MMKTARCVGAVLAGFAMLSLSAASAPAAGPPGFETYVVRHGDTLGKVAGRVFGDARRWRELLKDNPQVTNPNLIYPGDSLLVPLPATAALATPGADSGAGLSASAGAPATLAEAPVPAASGTGDQGAADAGAAAAAPGAAVEPAPAAPVRPVAVVNQILYRSAGSIADQLPALAIIASQDERILLSAGDAAIVNAPLFPGRRFTVVRADRRIYHPKTGEFLGWLIQVLGAAEVTCRGERTSTVSLVGIRDAAGVGDYLVPLDPDDVLKEDALAGKIKPECIPPGACEGVVVAFDDSDRLVAAEQDLAYIDRGTASGAVPGRRYLIYREIFPEGRVTVGELQVLRAGERTAAALITTSIQEVQVGDLLRAR